MSFKKITLAAAISIGMMAVGSAVNAQTQNCPSCPKTADQGCAAQQSIISSQQVNAPVNGVCPAAQGDLDYVERQVYAFPSLTGKNLVIPNDNSMVQLGQSTDVSVPTQNNITGAAAPIGQGVILNNRAGVGIAAQQTNLLGENAPTNSTASDITNTNTAYDPESKVTGGAASVQSSCDNVTGGAAPADGMSFQSGSGLQVEKQLSQEEIDRRTGAAAPIYPNQFTDVSSDFWASNQINKLAGQGILAGYPDRTYRPTLPTLRSEFASMIVAGLNLEGTQAYSDKKFSDIPDNHWARNDIYKAYNQGYMNGYSDNTFRPSETISRAEAFSTFAKALPGQLTATEAQGILSSYPDNNTVPSWARVGMAESISAGLTKDSPDQSMLNPNRDASRSEMAAVIAQLRQTLALDPSDLPTGAASEIQTFPTLSLKFNDMLHARASHIGDNFVAQTTEAVTINGQLYPEGSKVHGKIVEIVRPNMDNKGALKLAFDKIEYMDNEATLPRQILSAGVQREDNVNIVSRLVQFPFVWPGKVVGNVGRSASNIGIIASNTVEEMMNSTGFALGHVASGEFGAAGRSTLNVGTSLASGIWDTGRTAVSSVVGVFKESGDELTYIVNPDTFQISRINPDETIQIAFGCPQ